MDYNKLTLLLDDFKKIRLDTTDNPTFMEIAGYPHYENVCSNILAFFLDPDEPHRLYDLCLKSLLSFAGVQDILSSITVERELVTDANNRIDLVINSDSHIIAIENKIYASINNPLKDYANHLKQKYPNKQLLLIILGIDEFDIKGTDLYGFTPIVYSSYFDRVRAFIGEYLSKADAKYFTLLVDFMNTIENLTKGTIMNQDLIAFVSQRSTDIVTLLNEITRFKSELRRKVVDLGTMIDLKNKGIPVKQWYYREVNDLFDTLVHDINLRDDLPIAIDCYVRTSGWKVQIFLRSGGNKDELKLLLDRLKIPYKSVASRLEYPGEYSYNEKLDTLRGILQDIIDKITGSAKNTI